MEGTSGWTFSRLARWAARVTGHPAAFTSAVGLIVIWVATGPVFHFSDTWQLVINTGTTIVTFLMVFLLQHSQNRDTMAIHLKLDELVRAIHAAQNSMLNLDDLEEEELHVLLKGYQRMGQEAQATAATVGERSADASENSAPSTVNPAG